MRTRLLAIPLLIIVAGLVGVALLFSISSLPGDPVDEPDPDLVAERARADDVILPPVEEPDVDIQPPVEERSRVGDPIVTPIVHASVMIEFDGTIIHIDPHQSIDYSSYAKANIILITHNHQDHFDENKIKQLLGPSTRVFGPMGVFEASREIEVEVLSYGEIITIGGLEIEVIPAYNIQRGFHPRGLNNGYLLTIDMNRIFIGGDTECTPELRALEDIDIALLPIDGQFTMSPSEAAECFDSIRPKQAIPYHQNRSDPEEIRRLLSDSREIEVLVLPLP